ncbi:MAG: hypothetical protein IPP19_14680 [Verrucomicrobia bacterium]|nr:hypothetical protein [Verrucomicrobiota bacterium]
MKYPSLPLKITALAVLTASALFAADANPSQAVKRELDTNGLFLNYMDFEGGWKKVAQDVQLALKDTPMGGKDIVALAEASGLSQIRALGMSSTSLKGGYDNRIFLYTPGGRKGLFAVFPGEPAPFDGARYASADADFFLEMRLDAPAVINAITEITTSITGNKEAATMALDLLRKDPNGIGSLLDFSGRLVITARLHSKEEMEKVKAELSSKPPVDIFARAEKGGVALANVLAKVSAWTREESGKRVIFTTNEDNSDAVIIIEGETITAGLPRAFVEECLTRKTGLAQNPTFKQALAETAQKGQAAIYITPHALTELRGLVSSSSSLLTGMRMAGLGRARQRSQFANQLLNAMPLPTQPEISVLVARPDGLLIRARSVQSLKASLPAFSLLTPDLLGQIIRVGAIAYAEVGAEERAAEAIHKKISPDLDQVRTVAGKYFAAHPDEAAVNLSTLRETMPEEKLPALDDVEGEIDFSRQTDLIIFDLKGGRSIRHVFKLAPEQRKTIEATLKQIAEASVEYMLAGNSYVSISSLVEYGYMPKPETLVGEDYDQVTLDLNTPTLTVRTPGEQEVSYTRDPNIVMQARRRQAERQIAIEQNLAKIDAVAQEFLQVNPDESSVSYEQLAQKELLTDIKSVAGEDYAQELSSISKNQEKLSISTKRIGTVTWVRPVDEATQTDLTKRLSEIERKAAQYFAKNPKAEVVISGELLPAPVVKASKPTEAETLEMAEEIEKKLPDLTTLVIRRGYKSLKVTLENGQEIEVPRSKAK